MKVSLSRRGVSHASHRLHFLFHSLYLTAAAMEGHLFYSVMAGGTLLFMVGSALLEHDAA